jgi:1-acyl-sn-glycerol-3-phosphate acyltransferase
MRGRHRFRGLGHPAAVAPVERPVPGSRTVFAVAERVYPPVLGIAKTWFRAADLNFTLEGTENVPLTGGCVLVSTHVSYLDFIFVGLGALPSKRLVRFMAKKAVFDHKISGPLMRGMHHIPVDRKAGAGAYDAALAALRAGEVVGVFPEATISRSFEVKQLKTGAARMALETGVPIVPVAIWGSQRMWTKGRKRRLMRRHTPITIAVGPPVPAGPDDKPVEVTQRIAEALETLLHKAQESYVDQPSGPDDTWWLPVRLGGSAPTPEQARELDAKQGHLG